MIRRIIETIWIRLRKKWVELWAKFRIRTLTNKNFTIISNNCWAGTIYQSYGLKYNTPTLGLFFMAKDYIKFINSLKYYINQELKFIEPKDSKWYKKLKGEYKFGAYPIAKLDDIEIFFLHYKTEVEAKEKWESRKKRINYENILYKFSEMNYCDKDDIKKFQEIKLKNKICFISDKYNDLKNEYTYVVSKSLNSIKSYDEPYGVSKNVNITELLNKLK